MEKKIKKKFIAVATISIFTVLLIVLGIIDIISVANVRKEVFLVLKYIADNSGTIPYDTVEEDEDGDDRNRPFLTEISLFEKEFSITQEGKYEVRYFTAVSDESGIVKSLDMNHIAAVSQSDAALYTVQAVLSPVSKDIIRKGTSHYAYLRRKLKSGGYMVIFIDCSRQVSSVYATVKFSLYIGLACMVLFFIIVSIFAGYAMAPIINNMESQKQFITNASHELKTPLAVIRANTEVMEMVEGKSEWTESTKKQIQRMSELISQLITLSKLQEKDAVKLVEVDFTKETKDVTGDFKTVVENDGKHFSTKIAEGVKCHADEKGLHELISILLDNAAKYCDEGGDVSVTLTKRGKLGGILTVANSYKEGEGIDYERFFERFYREDSSHNQESKKGYGIGLSMAQNLTEMFRGRISAKYHDGMIYFIVTL